MLVVPQHRASKYVPFAGVYYEQGLLNEAIQTYQEAISREANFPEAYNNLGNALREANRMEEAMQCYTMCIQLQMRTPQAAQASGRGGGAQVAYFSTSPLLCLDRTRTVFFPFLWLE